MKLPKDILEAVEKIQELDLSEIKPTYSETNLVNVFAKDIPSSSLPLEDVFKNLDKINREGNFFKVPPLRLK